MTSYVVRRLVMAVVTVVVISMLTFLIIQLPEGDFVDSYVRELESFGANVSLQEAEHLREIWGLKRPLPVQYFKWITQLLQGNLGTSFSMQHHRPVSEIIADRLVMTVVLAGCSLVFTWIIALPIGIYSAVRQRTLGDYTATVVGYVGLATPDFLLALAVMYWVFLLFDTNLGGLFSDHYLDAPWSLGRLWDLLKHLPIPTAIVGLTGTAGLIRIMRANLIDELRKPYVVTARSKGMTEGSADRQVPGAAGAQSVRQHRRLHPAAACVRQHLRGAGDEPADAGAGALPGAAAAGHAAGRQHPADGEHPHRDRHLPVRYGPAVDRPSDSGGGALMAEAPVRAGTTATEGERQEALYSQWRLTRIRFLRHKAAVVSGVLLCCFYLVAMFADFIAYSDPNDNEAFRQLIPPQRIRLFDEGRFSPHVLELKHGRDATFRTVFTPVPDSKIRVRLFARGYEYRLLGIFPTDRHLLGTVEKPTEESLFLLGTDNNGRDLFSRLVIASRISLSIGLIGVTLGLILGIVLGGISGFYGGVVDSAIQRLIEILRSIPTIPLWMTLAAALPHGWSVVQRYLAITAILSFFAWTTLAREVRGRFLSLREEDYVLASEVLGATRKRVILRHMVPAMSSHIIATATLAIPGMILAETGLSFLGLGLRPPAISWGVMLQDTQNLRAIALSPWLMTAVWPVIVSVLAFNFVGDGLRDAADPYSI